MKLHVYYFVFCETSIIVAHIDKNMQLITFWIAVSYLPCGLDNIRRPSRDTFILIIDSKFILRGVLCHGSQPPWELLSGSLYTSLATFIFRDEQSYIITIIIYLKVGFY